MEVGSRNLEDVENGDSRKEEERALKKASNCESPKAEKVCRICHLSSEDSTGPGPELIPLGCDCRGELGLSHHNCAEAWFSQKGNRLCEICGKTARNIVVNDDGDTVIFMMEWNEMRLAAASLDGYDENSLARQRYKVFLCNAVLVFLLLVFILPWFFRGIMNLF